MLLTLAALAAPPVSLEDRERLDRREVVVHEVVTDGGASVVALAQIDAPPARVIDAVLRVDALPGRVRGLSSVDVYLQEVDRVGARVEARSFGMTWIYHAIFVADRSAGTVHYTLDPDRPSDFTHLDGWYRTYPEAGGTLLVNESTGDTGARVPAWIKRWFARRSKVDTLGVIREIAEG